MTVCKPVNGNNIPLEIMPDSELVKHVDAYRAHICVQAQEEMTGGSLKAEQAILAHTMK